jgi:L-aminopeptidase/D-esterase-like protein
MARTPSITDVTGILVGHYTYAERPTGCTVVTSDKPFVAGIDIRGVMKAESWGKFPAAKDYP